LPKKLDIPGLSFDRLTTNGGVSLALHGTILSFVRREKERRFAMVC
jgi:hypothetical protein